MSRPPAILAATAAAALLLISGCANFIREESSVIWDRIEGTDDLKVQSLDVEGGTAKLNLSYTCQRRQFAVTNEYKTLWNPAHEVYEIPVGLVAVVPSFLWYLGSSIVTLGGATPEITRGPLYWSVAGLNPAMPVENGMFVERYSIHEKRGSRRPQDGSKAEPWAVPVWVHDGELDLRFSDDLNRKRGQWLRDLQVGEELLVMINLLEAANPESIPTNQAQAVVLRAKVEPSGEIGVLEKETSFPIPPDVARRLYDAAALTIEKPWKLDEPERTQWYDQMDALGFGTEAAQLLRKR